MNYTMIGLALGSTLLVATLSASTAAPLPCEDMLKQLRSDEASAKLSDAEKVQVAGLEAKGIERCNADDDKRADGFFAEALKVVTKK